MTCCPILSHPIVPGGTWQASVTQQAWCSASCPIQKRTTVRGSIRDGRARTPWAPPGPGKAWPSSGMQWLMWNPCGDPLASERSLQIDAIRGLAVLLMVMVHAAADWQPVDVAEAGVLGTLVAGLGGLAAPCSSRWQGGAWLEQMDPAQGLGSMCVALHRSGSGESRRITSVRPLLTRRPHPPRLSWPSPPPCGFESARRWLAS